MSELNQEVPRLRVGTEWLDLTLEAGPYVVVTVRGYAAALPVTDSSGTSHELLAGAGSICEGIELLRPSRPTPCRTRPTASWRAAA